MPRNGTNFVADLLRSHSQIVVNPQDFWEFSPFRYQEHVETYLNKIASNIFSPYFYL